MPTWEKVLLVGSPLVLIGTYVLRNKARKENPEPEDDQRLGCLERLIDLWP